jgi:TolB protein
MDNKHKFKLGEDGEIEAYEPENGHREKLKRDTSLLARLTRSPLIPVLVLIQSLGLILVCLFLGLVLTGVIHLGPPDCRSGTICGTPPSIPTPVPAVSSFENSPPTQSAVVPCNSQFLAQTAAKVGFIASNDQYPYGAAYVLNIDSHDSCTFLSNPEGVSSITWSPDGKQVAFTTSRGLWLGDREGKSQHFVYADIQTDDPVDWSPDSQRILFSSKAEKVTVFDFDKKSPTALTDQTYKARTPRWSPDGKHIVFSSGKDADAELYVMDTDGNNIRRLTDNKASDKWPMWSLTGQQIIFTSDQSGNLELYSMELDGSNVRQLSNNSVRDAFPAVSMDTGRILFVSYADENNEIFLMGAGGDNLIRLTNSRINHTLPMWRH